MPLWWWRHLLNDTTVKIHYDLSAEACPLIPVRLNIPSQSRYALETAFEASCRLVQQGRWVHVNKN